MISDDIAPAPRLGWKSHARAALRNADPWVAWAEMRYAPREEIEEASLDKSLDKIISHHIGKAGHLEALGDLLRLAVEAGKTGAGGRRTIGAILPALANIASDEELEASQVYKELMPLAAAPELHTAILDVLLDVFEVFMGRAHVDESRKFLLAVLVGCRKRNYADVSAHALERMIVFVDNLT